MDAEVLYVTAFADIGREGWGDAFAAPMERCYHAPFGALCAALDARGAGGRLLVYSDALRTAELCAAAPGVGAAAVRPFDAPRTFLAPGWVEAERRVMAGAAYRARAAAAGRAAHPEHSRPEYTLLNHSKVEFLARAAAERPGHAFYAWVDYHQARHAADAAALAAGSACFAQLPRDRVTLGSFAHAHEAAAAAAATPACEAPFAAAPVLQGSVLVVPAAVVGRLRAAYEAKLRALHAAGLADDDQGVHLQLLGDAPGLYNPVRCPGWGCLLQRLGRAYGFERLPPAHDAFAAALRAGFHHFAALQRVVEGAGDDGAPRGIGSYLMDGRSLDYWPGMAPKQRLLFSAAAAAAAAGVGHALEVGVNAGHSLLLMLLAAPEVVVTAVDVCERAYTRACAAYLAHAFPGRVRFLEGDSHAVLARPASDLFAAGPAPGHRAPWGLVHLDGLHEVAHVRREIDLARLHAAPGAAWVLDDIEGLEAAGAHLRAAAAAADGVELRETRPGDGCDWPNALFAPAAPAAADPPERERDPPEPLVRTIDALQRGVTEAAAGAQTELCALMARHGSDKGGPPGSWHNYTPVYAALFARLRAAPPGSVRLFEVGLGSCNPAIPSNMGPSGRPGASLRGWADFLGAAAGAVWGADVDPDIRLHERGGLVRSFHVDQTDAASVAALWARPELAPLRGRLDVLVDDGLHEHHANRTLLEGSLHMLRTDGGVYVVEDVHSRDVPAAKALAHELEATGRCRLARLIDIPNRHNFVDNRLLVVVV